MTVQRVGDLTAHHESQPAAATTKRPVPVLFVHGLWATASLFDRYLSFAAERGWDAWAVNLRGREESRPGTDVGGASMQDFARDAIAMLDELGDVVLVGHSMGSLVAQMVGHDPRVRALVLMCPIPPRGIVSLSGPVLRSSGPYLGRMLRGRAFRPERDAQERVIMNRLAREDRDAWFASSVEDSGVAARQIALGAVKVGAAAIRAPVLVVSAAEDRISPPGLQPKIVRRYGAVHRTFTEHAHLLPLEPGWETPAASVLDWAEGILSP
jgi:pimeloyl-ACP methyl ester carboxylesterase